MLKPLIKYTGGKYKEYNDFKQYFPKKINNYYEPFFGGGGVFFRLYNDNKVDGKNYINDFSESLIEFYECVSADTFSIELNKLSNAWDFIRSFGEAFHERYGNRFKDLMLNKKDEKFINDEIREYIVTEIKKCDINTHGFSLSERIIKSLNDKLSRFRKKDISEDEEDIAYKCITTCICQAFYFIIRDMYNDWNNHGNKDKYTKVERSSHWVFIREYCFGSMFRFGSTGDFNIPYGGFGYNSKCFSCKIENMTSEEARNLFKSTDIQCKDFEEVINNWKYEKDDFMFLDPPYDSTFTEYDDNSFGKDEHIRLANCLKKCKCKWLMAIGKTDFIESLYKDCYILEYDKTYMYQARGKYDNKHTTHLIITNYPLDDKLNKNAEIENTKFDMEDIRSIIEETVNKALEQNIEKYVFAAIEKAFNIKINNNPLQEVESIKQTAQETQPIVENNKKKKAKKLFKTFKIAQCSKEGDIIKVYDSYEDVAKEHDITKTSLSQCFNGIIKTSHGFVWKRVD